MITIAIRTDASVSIGSGHMMRCLTLANQLRQFGANIFFICRELKGNSISLIEKKSFKVLTLGSSKETNIDKIWDWYKLKWKSDAEETIDVIRKNNLSVSLLIVDHYGIDEKWETMLRKHVGQIMVIDDLANRRHQCDFLLDQNIYDHLETRYDELVPDACIKFLGPNYMLLRNEFFSYKCRIREGKIANILVSFGGSDPCNETTRVAKILASLRSDFTANIVVGQSNQFKKEIQRLCNKNNNKLHYYYQIDNMAELINDADLSIGAGGTSMWERCFLGLPSLVITLAENQVEIAKMAQQLGIATYLGNSSCLSTGQISDEIDRVISQPDIIREMSQKASALFDKDKIRSFHLARKILGEVQ